MATLSQIIFRVIVKLGWTTKGSALTWTELDTNQEALLDAILALQSAALANVAPYNPLTVYSNTPITYVSYNGNMYQYINGTPSAGVTPDSDPLTWQLTSTGALSHQQGTDQTVGLGTIYPTSHQELWGVVNGQVIPTTVVAFNALVGGSALIPNRIYYFDTEGNYIVRATSTSTWSPRGAKLDYVPDITNYAQYDEGGSYSINDRATYNNRVYNNYTGVNGGITPDLDFSNWIEETAGTAPYYLKKIRDCIVWMDATNISGRHFVDDYGNEFPTTEITLHGSSDQSNNTLKGESTITKAWNYRGQMKNNVLINSYIEMSDELNTDGRVNNNIFENANFIVGDGTNDFPNRGTVENNVIKNCGVIAPEGLTDAAVLSGLTIDLPGQTIYLEDDTVASSGYLTIHGGNIPRQVNISSAQTTDITALGISAMDLYGIYTYSGNPTLDTLTGFPNQFPVHPVKIMPVGGATLDIDTKSFGGGIAQDQFLWDGTTLSLDGDKGDYIIAVVDRPDIMSGDRIWRIIQVMINA